MRASLTTMLVLALFLAGCESTPKAKSDPTPEPTGTEFALPEAGDVPGEFFSVDLEDTSDRVALKRGVVRIPDGRVIEWRSGTEGTITTRAAELLAKMTRLRTVEFETAKGVDDQIAKRLIDSRDIKVVIFRDCANLTNVGLAHCADIVQLERLSIENGLKFNDDGLHYFYKHQNIRRMYIRNCPNFTEAKMADLDDKLFQLRIERE
jgi:hypothetical protein